MTALERHFQDFIRERTYIENVTERTLAWYQTAFSAYMRARADAQSSASDPVINKRDLQQFISLARIPALHTQLSGKCR